ncbi:uncharacterized protein LOC142620230 [Castanea sativa]|uniref:uncharacterized protein LOC142620230 n=1 Tax=Castanea sativa TaxID=21020 RepID=UPI003F64AC0A
MDVFAWSPYEVPGVDPEFIVHKLNVDPLCPPKKQRPRRSAKEYVDAVRQEVGRLRKAGAIKETFFPEWLANTVVVKKKSGKWRFADRCRPFYQLLKKWKGFQWNEEFDRAFQDLKDYLGQAPTLSAPEPGEDLYVYLSVSEHAASAVLLRDNGAQLQVYYISKTLVDVETRYLPLEKLVLALVHSTRKLPHYFQAHTVHVLTEYPLQSLLRRSDFTGRIAKSGTRLGSFDIRYKPRNSVKGQVLADFIVEFSPSATSITGMVEVRPWRVFVDGASNTAGAGARIVVITPEDLKLEHSFRLGFRASNNEAEYEALLAGLRVVMDLGAKEVEVYSDSLLVVSQVQGNFEAKYPRMIEYLRLAKQLMGNFETIKIERVAWGKNRHADSLATLASSITDKVPRLIRVELVPEPSIATKALIVQVTEAEKCWMDPIIDFLLEDRTPEDEKEAARVRRTSAQYWLFTDRKLYRRSFEGPYLQCLRPGQAKELLVELQEGVCSSHMGGRSLAHRAMTQGF